MGAGLSLRTKTRSSREDFRLSKTLEGSGAQKGVRFSITHKDSAESRMTAVSRQPSTGHISRKPPRGPAPKWAAGFSRHDSVESRMTTVSRKPSMGPAPKRAAGFPSVVHNDSAESRMTAVSRKPSMGPVPRGGGRLRLCTKDSVAVTKDAESKTLEGSGARDGRAGSPSRTKIRPSRE